ncbi:hypothetical protein RB195_008504 [Necator americanus]|uniref:C2H2-type domain-containing protein n=1 Tax=Necator americanus TaxID=51031 RepID=A0ABR1CP08_NECAM
MDRQQYKRKNNHQKRRDYPNNNQMTTRYAEHITPIGTAHIRIYDNVGAATYGRTYIRTYPQICAQPPHSELDESNEYAKQYSFENFPVDMDGTESVVFGKYSVSLLEQTRFSAIFIRLKRTNLRDGVSMCAMISSRSSEYVIRSAVQECASNLERCEQLVWQGDRYPVSNCSVDYLKKHYIEVMDKVDESFPNAVYWCRLCDYHISSIQHVRIHFEQNQHFSDEQRMQERSNLMHTIPQLGCHQLEAINSAIFNLLHEEYGIRGPVWEQRLELMAVVEELLKRCVFEKMQVKGHIRVYGSTVAKTATEASDLNITIDIPDVDCSDAVETMKNVARLLDDATKEMRTLNGSDVQFIAETPMCIRLTISNVLVRITWRREAGLKLGSLLDTYANFRPQYPELCRVVRRWAQICGIYSVEKRQGGLTSYGFDLMVLYFLQQKKLLPCLHELRPMMAYDKKVSHVIDDYYDRRDMYENNLVTVTEKFGKLEKPWDLAVLFVEFLCFYGSRVHQNEVVQVITSNLITRDKTRWSRKLLQIADPFRTDNVVTFTKAYQSYFFNCFLKSYLYFAIPQTPEGPLLDVVLYQKVRESPRKKKSKRRRTAATTENAVKNEVRQENTMDEKMSYCSAEAVDIDDAEYVAAADAIAVDEEKKTATNNEIIENLMPVPKLLSLSNVVLDARVGHVETVQANKEEHSLSVAFVNGLQLHGDSTKDILDKGLLIAKTAANEKDVVLGCSLMDLPDEFCGSYILPTGQVFFVPERSSCGFLINSRWITRVVDVVRLKKGLYEVTVRISVCQEIKLLYCLQLSGTYPIRRLHERVKELENATDMSIIVIFGSEGTSSMAEIQLAEECEALGLDVWAGLFKEEARTLVATRCSNELFNIEDLTIEEIEDVPLFKECFIVRAAICLSKKSASEPPNDIKIPREEDTKERVAKISEKMQNSKRKKEEKIKRAERRREEKERAAQFLQRLMEEEKAALKAISPGIKDDEAAVAVESVISQEAVVNYLATVDDSNLKDQDSKGVAERKAKRKRNRKKTGTGRAEDAAPCDSAEAEPQKISYDSVLTPTYCLEKVPILEEKVTVDLSDNVLTSEDTLNTSLVHDIPMKDLNPENVEIDDDMVYSRRTMCRIRKYNPIRIPRASFGLLERYGLQCRDFKERDNEVDSIRELRRQGIRNERKRCKLRAEIGDAIDQEVEKVEGEMRDLNPFDAQVGITDEYWLQSVQNEEDDLPDTTVDSIEDAADLPENETANEQKNKEDQPKSLICYEDFFIRMKDFDPDSFRTKVDELNKDSFVYSFDNAENFNNGYKPDMVCASCESCEHWSDACPLMTIPKAETFSHKKEKFEWIELDHVILGTYEKNRVKDHRIEKLLMVVGRIRSYLEKDLRQPVRLDVFGSLVNGLGAGSSDVDICFRFTSDEQPLNVDGVEIVREISQSLQKMKGLERVYAITGAKVPIVKFLWPKFGFEGDISYYNVLALYNTQLLKSYCEWDHRVAPIGVWVKRWAKSCDIGDASRGSLSSYAMIILLIHYLQNCEPPVLPRLQEDFRNGEVNPIWVENHDVYYHKEVVQQWSQNQLSVAELFIGFLDYYARFDFQTQVVQIRRKKPLLKMEKDWNRSVCIEDPFDLNHNLGAGVTKKMFVFIVRNIHNSRKHFTLSDIRREFLEKKEISTDKQMLPSLIEEFGTTLLKKCEMGSAPSDRQCRICHRVGHFAESCPKSQHCLRTPRKEPWPKKAPNGNGQETPRGNQSSGRSFFQGGRSFHRKVERRKWQDGRALLANGSSWPFSRPMLAFVKIATGLE